GGPLEVFGLDRPVEPTPQALEPLLHLGRARVRREIDLPDVLRAAVDPTEQSTERRRERLVAVGASQATRLPEVLERQPAVGAFLPSWLDFLALLVPHLREEVRQRNADRLRRALQSLLRGALLAEVERRPLVVDDLGEMHDGVGGSAVVTHHFGHRALRAFRRTGAEGPLSPRSLPRPSHPYTRGAGWSRPESSSRTRVARPARSALWVTT